MKKLLWLLPFRKLDVLHFHVHMVSFAGSRLALGMAGEAIASAGPARRSASGSAIWPFAASMDYSTVYCCLVRHGRAEDIIVFAETLLELTR